MLFSRTACYVRAVRSGGFESPPANYCEAVLGSPGGRSNQATPAASGDSAAAATAMVGPPRSKPARDAEPTMSDFIEIVIDTAREFLDSPRCPASSEAAADDA